MADDDIAVVYLARFAEGVEPVRTFARSWKKFAPGVQSTLTVVWKGFPDNRFEGTEQHAALSGISHASIAISDNGFDLTAYKIAAEKTDHRLLCFLNTFSRIEVKEWLAHLHRALNTPGTGAAGATGSYESVGQSMKLMNLAVWYCCHGIRYDRVLAKQWRDEIMKFAPKWLEPAPKRWARHLHRTLVTRLPYPSRLALAEVFEDAWKPSALTYDRFPAFPNPHLRSNAFLIPRGLFLDCVGASRFETKDECYEFESGYSSITRKLALRGLRSLVVGADGRYFSESSWRDSHTFRSGKQRNLLVSDNQTRGYDTMSRERQMVLASWTWGDGTTFQTSPLEAPYYERPTIEKQLIDVLPDPYVPLPYSPYLFQ